MPRPSKRVPPDTLGGRIRIARQNLHLSLSAVAGEKYSTSLISQIERNRVDPSQESLYYLAERLQLPFEDLLALAQQNRESEIETHTYKVYEEQRTQATQLLERNQPKQALELLQRINILQFPSAMRWRIFALRGECYFSLRKFLLAQSDFLSALAGMLERVPADQRLEAIILHLHLAASSRELGQLDAAAEQYAIALKMMNTSTPLRYIAETHWGIALVFFERAESNAPNEKEAFRQEALEHAEMASRLYASIGETLRASLLECQIALIEQASGNLKEAHERLQKVLDSWLPTLHSSFDSQYTLKERANVVSAAACYLARIELEEHNCSAALDYVKQALEAGQKSYTIRRAEAYMILGQIQEARNDPEAEEAYKKAVNELASTDRVAALIRAHDLLGRYLMKQDKIEEGEKEFDIVLQLSNVSPLLIPTNAGEDNNSGK